VRLRLTLYAQLDRLDTLYAVHLGNFAPAAYASFRSAGIGRGIWVMRSACLGKLEILVVTCYAFG